MKKIILITLSSAVLLFSCTSEPSTPSEVLSNEAKELNIDSLNDMELYYYMEELEKKLLNLDSIETSKPYSVKMLESVQKHIVKFPKSENRREVIRKGVGAAMGLRQEYEAVRLNNIIIDENPEDSTIYTEMSLNATILDNMGAKEEAKKVISSIIEKFPTHKSIDDFKSWQKTIDLNPEELIQFLNEQNAK